MKRRYFLFCIWGILFFLCSAVLCVQTARAEKDNEETRSSTPQVLIPQASGNSILGTEPLIIDISHMDQGYIMAKYTGTAAKANIQITGPDQIRSIINILSSLQKPILLFHLPAETEIIR